MGLDQYLYEEVYLSNWEHSREREPDEYAKAEQVREMVGLSTTPDAGGVTVRTPVMYWRKANQIHNWFVQNVQDGVDDGGTHYVSRDQLIELRDLCQQVLDSIELVPAMVKAGHRIRGDEEGIVKIPIIREGLVVADSTVAEELLPTTEGFFFGSTDYDEWYADDLKRTIEGLTRVLDHQRMETTEKGTTYPVTNFYYHASW